MSKLSPTQQRILEAASNSPEEDIRSFMEDLKSPAIKEKVLNSLQQKGLIAANEESYLISEEGLKAVSPEAKPLSIPSTGDPKKSKQDLIIDMLKKKEGTTIAQIMEKTGWQRHSVHGYISGTLKKKLGYKVVATKGSSSNAIYKIV